MYLFNMEGEAQEIRLLCVEDLEGRGILRKSVESEHHHGKEQRGVGRRAVLKMGDDRESGGNGKDPMETRR